jgi:hypothetical protein
MMNIRSFIGIACAAVAIATAMPAAAQDRGETITPHFEQAIPNIPGKSLVAQTLSRRHQLSPIAHYNTVRTHRFIGPGCAGFTPSSADRTHRVALPGWRAASSIRPNSRFAARTTPFFLYSPVTLFESLLIERRALA